ncbi:hypothetical protein GGF31_007482 [Allomyces arbusculus]|nr:hypothetical protein GGF31_007482 [Allomyces arbusculus]
MASSSPTLLHRTGQTAPDDVQHVGSEMNLLADQDSSLSSSHSTVVAPAPAPPRMPSPGSSIAREPAASDLANTSRRSGFRPFVDTSQKGIARDQAVGDKPGAPLNAAHALHSRQGFKQPQSAMDGRRSTDDLPMPASPRHRGGSRLPYEPLNVDDAERYSPDRAGLAAFSVMPNLGEWSQWPSRFAWDGEMPWTTRLYLLLEDPSSSREALAVSIVVTFMIVFAATVVTIETIPALYLEGNDLWSIRQGLEIFIIVFFTFEYLLRLAARADSWASAWQFIKSPLGIIDLLAIVPYYVELASPHAARPVTIGESPADAAAAHMSYVFRITILKVFRLFRVFRVFKHSSLIQLSIEVLIIALKRSLDALSALLFFTLMIILLFSTLLYYAERGTWDPAARGFLDIHGRPSRFDSIPAACWFVIVTLTTTGYGDMVPQTFVGKLIAFPAMMCGILIIALPSIIVGRNFTIVWEFMKAQRDQLQLEHDYQAVPGHDDTALQNTSGSPAVVPTAPAAHTGDTPTVLGMGSPHLAPRPATATPQLAAEALPSASLFDDPFSLGAGAASSRHLLPRDTKQLVRYVAALAHTMQVQHVQFNEALSVLRERLEIEDLVAASRAGGAGPGTGAAGGLGPGSAVEPGVGGAIPTGSLPRS